METKNKKLQNTILNWIQKNDNSVIKLSRLSGISTATIRNTLKGRNSPNIRTICRILSITAGNADNAIDYMIPKRLPQAIIDSNTATFAPIK